MKQYEKPRLIIEKFELNQNIAACKWDMTLKNENECSAAYDPYPNGYNPNGFPTIFTSGVRECRFQLDADDNLDDMGFEYCYTTGESEIAGTFSS